MDILKDFFLDHLQIISFITVSLGLILLTVYIVIPHFRGFNIFKIRKKDKTWLKKLEPYLDEDGKLVFEKLASVWVEGSMKNKYTKEDIKYIWERAIDRAFLPYVRKTEAVMAEHVRPLDINDEEYYQQEDPIEAAFKKIPKDEILAVFSDKIFNQPIPGIENLTEQEQEKLKQEVIEYFINKYKTIGDIKEEEVIDYYKNLISKKAYKDSISIKEVEKNIQEEEKKVREEQKRDLLLAIERTKEIVSSTLAGGSYLGNTEGNLPDSIKQVFLEIGYDRELVDRINIPRSDMMYYENKFQYVYEENFILLLGFFNALVKKRILSLFIREKYDLSKVLKNYFLFCLDNYNPGIEGKGSYSKFINTAKFLFFLKNVNTSGYFSYISKNLQMAKFLPIVMSCLFEEYDSNLLPEFLKFLKENINIKKANMMVKDVSEFAKEDQIKEVFFDKIGFTFKKQIYLFPKAINIYFGEYFLAVPYILNGLLEFYFHYGFDIYAKPYLVMYKTEDSYVKETTKILSKITDDKEISSIIYNSLDHKEIKISEFKNIVDLIPQESK